MIAILLYYASNEFATKGIIMNSSNRVNNVNPGKVTIGNEL